MIMQDRLLTVAVLAQVIVEAVNEAGLAVGERDLPVKIFRHLSAHSSLVAVVCGLLDLVDVYAVEPVVEKRQKRIFGRIVVAVKEALVLAFKLVLRLSDSLVYERFRGACRRSKPQPFGFVFLCYGILVADHQIQHPSLFLNASRDIFTQFICHISIPPFALRQHTRYHIYLQLSSPVGSKLHLQHNFFSCVFPLWVV